MLEKQLNFISTHPCNYMVWSTMIETNAWHSLQIHLAFVYNHLKSIISVLFKSLYTKARCIFKDKHIIIIILNICFELNAITKFQNLGKSNNTQSLGTEKTDSQIHYLCRFCPIFNQIYMFVFAVLVGVTTFLKTVLYNILFAEECFMLS